MLSASTLALTAASTSALPSSPLAARLKQQGVGSKLRRERMASVNPAYIPRNHRVEEVIRAAEDHGDLAPFFKLHGILARPFDEQPEHIEFQKPPRPEEVVHATFCGT